MEWKAQRHNKRVRAKRGDQVKGDNPRGLVRTDRRIRGELYRKGSKYLPADLGLRQKFYFRQESRTPINARVLMKGRINKLLDKPKFEHLC